MALSKHDREWLPKQIFWSEVDYEFAKRQVAVLEAILIRTPAQEAELASWRKKIAHDDVLIAKWVKMLKDDGVVDLAKLADSPERIACLDEFVDPVRERVAVVIDEKELKAIELKMANGEVLSSLEAVKSESITVGEFTSIADAQAKVRELEGAVAIAELEIDTHNAKLAIVEDLKAEVSIWPL